MKRSAFSSISVGTACAILDPMTAISPGNSRISLIRSIELRRPWPSCRSSTETLRECSKAVCADEVCLAATSTERRRPHQALCLVRSLFCPYPRGDHGHNVQRRRWPMNAPECSELITLECDGCNFCGQPACDRSRGLASSSFLSRTTAPGGRRRSDMMPRVVIERNRWNCAATPSGNSS